MSIDLDFFGLTKEVAMPIAHSFSTNKIGGGKKGGIFWLPLRQTQPPLVCAGRRRGGGTSIVGKREGNNIGRVRVQIEISSIFINENN
jgi:hypothetical protein